MVRLQFLPNNDFVERAARFSGKLGVKREVQTRTLRKQHMDQHWVNAYTRYILEWLIQLRKIYSGAEFFSQDNKAKIPVGDTVQVSTGVRPTNTAIVNAEGGAPAAADHDFHLTNIIAPVTL